MNFTGRSKGKRQIDQIPFDIPYLLYSLHIMSFSRASQQTLRQAVKAVAPKASKQVAQRSYSLLSRQAPAAMMASRLGVSRTVLFSEEMLM